MLPPRKTLALLFSLSLISQNLADLSLQDLAPRAPPPSTPWDPPPDRTTCQPAECPRFCTPGNLLTIPKSKRSFSGAPSAQWLRKRFFEPTDSNQLVNELLEQPYCGNLAAEPNTPSTYIWHAFDSNEYASATKGLSGCTAILIASQTGVFSSHIWEQDPNTNDDLQEANYANTMRTLSTQLIPHASDLAGGEAWIVLPSQTNNAKRPLYAPDIVAAITNTVKAASGLTAQTVLYVPLDWKKITVLGTNQRGTAAVQYDPAYKSSAGAGPGRAYRLWAESAQLSEKIW